MSNNAHPQESAVLAPLLTLLDGLALRDASVMHGTLLPGGHATLMREGRPMQLSFDAFVERLATPGHERREETIHDAIVHVDGDVAVIWAPYRFFIDGQLHHQGTDVVSLAWIDGRWLITALLDDSQPA